MAHPESLALRIRQIVPRRRGIIEKKMFGGVGFLLNDNMCVGVWKTSHWHSPLFPCPPTAGP